MERNGNDKIIDFMEETQKRDKLNKLFNLCKEFVPKFTKNLQQLGRKYPGFHCKGGYTAKDGNYVTVRIYPARYNSINVSLNSKVGDSQQYKHLSALIDIDREVIFIYGSDRNIMRTAEGEIVEWTDWIDCDLHIPKLIPELSQSTRKIFEEDYDVFYANNVVALEIPEDPKSELIKVFRDAIKSAEREEQKRQLELIKADIILSNDKEEIIQEKSDIKL